MSHVIPREELRSLVREALQDLLPAQAAGVPSDSASRPVVPGVPDGRTQPDGGPMPQAVQDGGTVVALSSDADLESFVRRLLRMFQDPRHRQDLLHGRIRFRLANPASAGPGAKGSSVLRVDRGAVTERRIRDAARAGARVVLGKSAVLTPLARDRARALGVDIEKER